jgi:hypothetical protein
MALELFHEWLQVFMVMPPALNRRVKMGSQLIHQSTNVKAWCLAWASYLDRWIPLDTTGTQDSCRLVF